MQNKHIVYISTLCGLELDEIILFKIREKTKGYNATDFINFIESNLDHPNLSYKNPLQKFLTFCRLYNSMLLAKKKKDIQTDSQKLSEKFRKIKVVLENEILQGKSPELSFVKDCNTHKNYFSDFEITILKKIGNVGHLIRLCDSFDLVDKINDSILSTLYSNSAPMLTSQSRTFKRIHHAS